VEKVCNGGHVAIPETLSAQVKVTVTGVAFHPLADATGEAVALIEGGVTSRLTVAQVVAERPAESTAVPQMDW